MRIRKIELLSDYKCFKKGTIFNFHDSPIICIIGKNSTGKTIFLELINDIINFINRSKEVNDDIKEFTRKDSTDFEELNKDVLETMDELKENDNIDNFCYIQIEQKYEKEEFEKDFEFEIDFCYNNIDYTITKDNKIYNFNMLPLITKKHSGLYQKKEISFSKENHTFNKILSHIGIKYSIFSSFYKRNKELQYVDLSSGEKSLIDVFSLFSEKNNLLTEECLYLIDEPDKNLNNELKRKYISLLEEVISEDDQIIFTTHSTELISDLKEIQVYKCENFEIKNINFNPFGQDSSVLTEKLFDDKFSISDIAKNTYDNYREKIKSASIDELDQLRKEIRSIFSDNIYRNELLELINNYLSSLNR